MTATQPPIPRSQGGERTGSYIPASDTRRVTARARQSHVWLEALVVHVKAGLVTAGLMLVASLLGILMIPRRYTSEASFVVEAPTNGALSSAMAVISQLNPNLAGGDSPKFYV